MLQRLLKPLTHRCGPFCTTPEKGHRHSPAFDPEGSSPPSVEWGLQAQLLSTPPSTKPTRALGLENPMIPPPPHELWHRQASQPPSTWPHRSHVFPGAAQPVCLQAAHGRVLGGNQLGPGISEPMVQVRGPCEWGTGWPVHSQFQFAAPRSRAEPGPLPVAGAPG